MAEPHIIDSSDGGLYLDEANYKPLPTYIGPFPSREAAEAYLNDLGPLWGSYTIPVLTSPESEGR